MSEQEYITVRDLGHLRCAAECLRLIVPDTSKIINKEEYQEVVKKLSEWESAHFYAIKLNNDGK